MTKITPEQAAEVLQKERLERAEKCNTEIGEILEKYKCQISARPGINAEGRIVVQVEIMAV